MGQMEELVRAYERFISLPWEPNLAGPQKVWFVLYTPSEERRLRARIGEFELATRKHHHRWAQLDLTDAFAQWMAAQNYRESYFESPDDLELVLSHFGEKIAEDVRKILAGNSDQETVVALSGIASLFGLTRVSELVQAVAPQIGGRLLVFFPGERDGNHYRLLDARAGWNYLAVPITASSKNE